MSLSAMIISSEKLNTEDFKEIILAHGGFVSSGKPLGGEPQVMIELNLDHTEHAKLIYLKVFLSFAEAWPCVLNDVDDSILSHSSVCEKYKNLLGGL
jgi:hypothetical protein